MSSEVTQQTISKCDTAINIFQQALEQYKQERAIHQQALNHYDVRIGEWQKINADFQAKTAGSNGDQWSLYWQTWLAINPQPIVPKVPPFKDMSTVIACQECKQSIQMDTLRAEGGDLNFGGNWQIMQCQQNLKVKFAEQQQQKTAEEEAARKAAEDEEARKEREERERQAAEAKAKAIADLRAQQAQSEIKIRDEEHARAVQRADKIRSDSAAQQAAYNTKLQELDQRRDELGTIDYAEVNNIKAARETALRRDAKKIDTYMIIVMFIYVLMLVVIIALNMFYTASPQNVPNT